jgi:hypothetical protein
MLKQPTARVLRVSKAFIEASSFEFFARAQGYSSVSAARVVVCRWRDEYGVVLFPYKNRGRANRVSEISAAWCASNNPRAIAKKLEFPSVEALFTTICRLRTKHGTVLFPLKKNHTRIKKSSNPRIARVASPINHQRLSAAALLWRSGAPTNDVAASLGLKVYELTLLINEQRALHGLQMFPYRGMVVQ